MQPCLINLYLISLVLQEGKKISRERKLEMINAQEKLILDDISECAIDRRDEM